MAVTTQDIKPPLSRSDMNKALGPLRLILGVVLVAYCAISTIDGFHADCGPLCDRAVWRDIGLWIPLGALLAGLISLCQWLTSERWPTIYFVLLFIDARYTQRWVDDWLVPVALHNIKDDQDIARWVGIVLSWVLAILMARFGEILLLGARQKPQKASDP